MTRKPFKQFLFFATSLAVLAGTASFFGGHGAQAAVASKGKPALVVSTDPLPQDLGNKVYNKPVRVRDITPQQVMGQGYYSDTVDTVVGRKVSDLRNELFTLQGKIGDLTERLARLESGGQNQSSAYFAAVATINTQLQSGTTPGNPRLVNKLTTARAGLESLEGNIASLNDLAVDISGAASSVSYLMESVRSTYSLSGAVEEDHVRLAQLEDSVNNTSVVVDRLLNNVNDDITRTTAYLSTERENLRTLSLAITTGDLFGKSLSNRPFSNAQLAGFTPDTPFVAPASTGADSMEMPAVPASPVSTGALSGGPRPLVKIKFDRPDVSFEQPVYMAVNEALARYPNARFELVAVHPSAGNAAQTAIESTRARRNAERVLRSLTQMGLDLNRVDLSYSPSAQAATNEVHLYIR
jgi:hypothetical protein